MPAYLYSVDGVAGRSDAPLFRSSPSAPPPLPSSRSATEDGWRWWGVCLAACVVALTASAAGVALALVSALGLGGRCNMTAVAVVAGAVPTRTSHPTLCHLNVTYDTWKGRHSTVVAAFVPDAAACQLFETTGTAAICYAHKDVDTVDVLGTERAARYTPYARSEALGTASVVLSAAGLAIIAVAAGIHLVRPHLVRQHLVRPHPIVCEARPCSP
jgi:hypothetical protein